MEQVLIQDNMAHFAKLNVDNIVENVVVVDNSVLLKEDGTEDEQKGITYLTNLIGSAIWVQTSYNDNFRKKYAGIGDFYDSAKDKFISPQPFPSWSLDSNDDWQAPVAKPEDDPLAQWDEESLTWIRSE
tara:strand:+ start:12733 stop:13119 length:387 start_codon:yes stop_codon:yes gene_type:complete